MEDITDAAIASPHWEACNICIHHGVLGCKLPEIELSVHLGDWIICENYQQQIQETKS